MTGRTGHRNGAPRGLAGPRAEKSVSLALQGGGAHGAFTWGVLDAILEDGRFAIEAITGASAGSMNAVVLAEGWVEDGPDGAVLVTRSRRLPAGLGRPIGRFAADFRFSTGARAALAASGLSALDRDDHPSEVPVA